MSIDFFPTPEPLVRATLKYIKEKYFVHSCPKTILDIGCGDGIYCKLAKELWPNAHTRGYDIVDRSVKYVDEFRNYDYLATPPINEYDLIIGNVPYSSSEEILTKAYKELSFNGIMQNLLLLQFLGSQSRGPHKPIKERKPWTNFFGNHPLYHIQVLSKRPSFMGGPTDSREYANFYWTKGNDDLPTLDWMQW